MGQKVNPHGFRLGITTDHTSRRYGDKQYSEYVGEDVNIHEYLAQTLRRAGIVSSGSSGVRRWYWLQSTCSSLTSCSSSRPAASIRR